MRIVLVQNKVCEDIQETLDLITEQLNGIENFKPDFIVFPEMFTTPYDLESFISYRQDENGEVLKFLKKMSTKFSSYVVGGSVPFQINGKLYNSSFVYDRTGNLIDRYDKIHLFEITYPDGTSFKESDVLTAGEHIGLFDTEFGTMGLMICFDIRFPYLSERLMESGVKVIFAPSAFNNYTGPIHWRTTFESRAIDNQLFVVGCSPSADSYGSYNTYGHSLIVDPFGTVLEELGPERGIIQMKIDLDRIELARTKIPIIKNRKKINKG